jgi:hypothetical protein
MKSKTMMVMVMFALVGFATFAFAGGMEHGRSGGWQGCQAMKNLSADDQAKVKAEQDAFRTDIAPLRQQIQQQYQNLKAEMTKTDTDAQKAVAIQTAISDLMAQMAQKRLQHQLNLKTINPALGNCFPGGPGMGPGHGMGPGMNPNNNTNTPPQTQG